jgi:glycosyltransferase involved in cell wall biosynthesis
MAPTQRHRWLTRPDNRERRRRAQLRALDVDVARAGFEQAHPGLRFGPVVALIAAYHEERNLGEVLKEVPTLVGDLEVSTLVVVDGGTDATARVARDAGVATAVLPVNLGQGAALRLGYDLALDHGARYVVTLDADGQNDPSELGSLLGPLLDDRADFVIASRRLGTDRTTDRFRRAGVRCYAGAIEAITGQRLTDTSNGYRAFRAELLADVVPSLREDQYQTAEVVITAARRGWRIAERPTVWYPRASGTSKKGGNLYFGLQYARAILSAWARSGSRPRTRPGGQ